MMTEYERQLPVRPSGVIRGDLAVPDDAIGVVVFAHGSGSSRFSPRNRQVAASLQRRSFATLLFDLLTEDEEVTDRHDGRLRFDIEVLAQRLELTVTAARDDPITAGMPIGLFGASTGAAAALVSAAHQPASIAAVV